MNEEPCSCQSSAAVGHSVSRDSGARTSDLAVRSRLRVASPGAGWPLQFGILGPLEVRRAGELLDVGGPKQRAVLGLLVVEANRLVLMERLVDQLWTQPPPRAAGTLQSYICRLRRALEPEGHAVSPRVLISRCHGYQLQVDPDQVDAFRFERLAEEGRDALAAADPELAAGVLGTALAIWRGSALVDFADTSFAAAEIARLEELRLSVTEDRMEAALALGHHHPVVAELEHLVVLHPFRERLWGQLMLALYRAARQAEALRAYRTACRVLGEELGLVPGRALTALEGAILRQEPDLDWVPPRPGGRGAERRCLRQPARPTRTSEDDVTVPLIPARCG